MATIKHILAVIDDKPNAKEVIKRSLDLCAKLDAKLVVLHTIHIPFLKMPMYVQDVPIDKKSIKESIDEKISELKKDNSIDHYTMVYFGDSSERAIIEAKRDDIDLIVSNSEIDFKRVVSEAKKPILVVKNPFKNYRTVLIPTDLSEKSKESIYFVRSLFKSVSISVVYGYERIAMVTSMYDISYTDMLEYQRENREISEKLLKNFKEEVDVDGDLIDATFSLGSSLVEYIDQKEPDLVVVAAKSSPDAFNFDSISSYIAQESSKDVLIYL